MRGLNYELFFVGGINELMRGEAYNSTGKTKVALT